jgi:uncharacterized cupin superfamily protein
MVNGSASLPKKIDLSRVPKHLGTGYPAPFDAACALRLRQKLGDAANLSDFGVNLLRLPPGTWSSQRHWHSHEDEFVFVLEGELVLVTNAGQELLRAGECAGFKAGDRDGHHLQNRSQQDALVLEVGSRKDADDETDYPDVDLMLPRAGGFVHRDGLPYPRKISR